jgi:hypothetical protein
VPPCLLELVEEVVVVEDSSVLGVVRWRCSPCARGDFAALLDFVWVELVTEELDELCVVDPTAELVSVLEVALELEDEEDEDEEDDDELDAVEVCVIVGPVSGPAEPRRSGPPPGTGLTAASAGGS